MTDDDFDASLKPAAQRAAQQLEAAVAAVEGRSFDNEDQRTVALAAMLQAISMNQLAIAVGDAAGLIALQRKRGE